MYTEIIYPTEFKKIDSHNDNIDVIVKYDSKYYSLVFTTPDNLKALMEKEKVSYLEAGAPMAIVQELTRKNIESAVLTYCKDDAFWLKIYGLQM